MLKESLEIGKLQKPPTDALFDWALEADLVLLNSTCYSRPLMKQLAKMASRMKKGSWIFSLDQMLPSADKYTSDVNDKLPV